MALDAFVAAVAAEIAAKGSPESGERGPAGMSESRSSSCGRGGVDDYVVVATDAERRGADDGCVFCRIAASGPPSADNGSCGAAS